MPTDLTRELREYLNQLPAGPVTDSTGIETLLVQCWDGLVGSGEGGMTGLKLYNRMEDVQWESPQLSFEIERHGAMKFGSTRAEVQTWVVDVDGETAYIADSRRRQVGKPQAPLRVEPLVDKVVELLLGGADDPCLKWQRDKTRVTIRIGKIIPDNCCQQTLAGRRKRFCEALAEKMEAHGWEEVFGTTPNTYEKKKT